MEYQLELKQVVDYPRCRIYRQFIRTLMEDRSIRTSGCSDLFYFVVLCSYANFRTSYRKIDGISYTIYPGEWICPLSEITEWFRTRYKYQTMAILDHLQEHKHISYSKIGRGQVIKFKIIDWKKNNTILDYNCPCQKDIGFFFFPIYRVSEFVSMSKCSEMDIILDLWMHTIYNDEQVQGSDVGPVVYFRNESGMPFVAYSELAQRWGLSKATVGRVLKKLAQQEYLSLLSFPGRHGSVIYLNSYLSTMFQISDILIDKEEVSLSLNIKITTSDSVETEPQNTITEEQTSVSLKEISVSKSHINQVIKKVSQILAASGLSCCECPNSKYKLYPLSPDCKEDLINYQLIIACREVKLYHFELRLSPLSSQIQKNQEVYNNEK